MIDGNDGCCLNIYFIDFKRPQQIDYDALVDGLMGRKPATDDQVNEEFGKRLRMMKLPWPETIFVWQAWCKSDAMHLLTFAERMALARTCRRIIREAKETKEG